MTADYLIKILGSCDSLVGYEINADYLDKENNSVSIAPCGGENTSRLYCDGTGIYFRDFECLFRIAGGKARTAENRIGFEKLSEELLGFGKATDFPQIQGSEEPIQILFVRDAVISSDELHSALYKAVIRLYYFK